MNKNGLSVEELKEFGITKQQLIRVLRGEGKRSPQVIESNSVTSKFRFAVVSDTHIGSKLARLDELHTFYDICREKKIKDIIHAGDIVDGNKMFFGHEAESLIWGSANQAKAVVDDYPKVKGIKTYFILGNHDACFYKQNGVDIGDLIAQNRDDMIYCGQFVGEVVLGGVKIKFMHPDGFAYAISYKPQKITEQIPSGEKPHIMVFGHWHQAIYFFYRNIHILNAGAFQGQSQFLLRKGVNPTIGGWIVEISVADDKPRTILSFNPTFIPFIK